MSQERCPQCGVRCESQGLGIHMRVRHGMMTPKKRRALTAKKRAVLSWITEVPNGLDTTLAVQMALGEHDLRSVLRSLVLKPESWVRAGARPEEGTK
jgi:hypothetical protein